MKGLDHYVGQVLDEKYRLERLLGSGGMGAVYLATHLGTERYVALKLITPQLMRNEEFVERFKREARAAGRLRHPNVVDVTDFGFASAIDEPVAYLVMEYLDGCTLADVLREEKRLPLEWVVDILEQVCSAVHEAHQQGIVHRDLKPENIWLEPTRLGGYRVKVLDFGIAKLAETAPAAVDDAGQQTPIGALASSALSAGSSEAAPRMSPSFKPQDLETETLLYGLERGNQSVSEPTEPGVASTRWFSETQDTQLFTEPPNSGDSSRILSQSSITGDEGQTLKLDQATRQTALRLHTTVPAATVHSTGLTRVGAIMGTPLYMSPEQCAAKNLDARSDIYSLGVIAYQMLGGEPPFAGDTASIMRGHLETTPPRLRDQSKKPGKRVAEVIMSALAKDPADRPQTASAFANSLRANADSIGALYRRAFALYSEHFPKFLKLSLIAHIPVVITTFMLIGLELMEKTSLHENRVAEVAIIVAAVVVTLLQVTAYFVAASVMSGVTAVIVTQLSVVPLRPVKLRVAFAVLKRRWRPFLKTSVRVTLRIVIGFLLFIVPGIIMFIRYVLYAPVVLLEGLEKKAAMLRARELAARSWRTIIIVALLQFLIPMGVSAVLSRLSVRVNAHDPGARLEVTNSVYQQLSGLANIFIVPLTSIVPALLYLRMRQLGGETLVAAWEQVEEDFFERSEWQQRMRTRLGLTTPRSTTPRPNTPGQ